MKRILGLLCIVAIIATSMISTSVVSLAETTNGPTVTNIYATGNWIDGETVTAHYTTQDENVKIQWWKAGNLKTGKAIEGATSDECKLELEVNYTLTYFTITDSLGKVYYSPVYYIFEKTQTSSAVNRVHLILKNEASSFVPGAIVGLDCNAVFVGSTEGTHTYEWFVKDSRSDTGKKVGTSETYTIQDSDYGKYLEGAITVYDTNGTKIKTKKANAYVGCKLDVDSTIVETSNSVYAKSVKEHMTNRLWYHSEDSIYCQKVSDGTNMSLTIDAGKIVKFDGFDMNITGVGSGLTVEYSYDNSKWETMSGTENLVNESKVENPVVSNSVLKARYFKLSFNTTADNYGVVYSAFPYLSAANKSADDTDITSVGCGAEIDNANFSITNILYGTPVGKLTESIVPVEKDATITLTDADGASVDSKDAKITAENVSGYRVKVTYGESSQIYTLAIADALKKIDISNMTDDATKRYTINEVKNSESTTEETGYEKNLPETKATYWYSSAEYTNTAQKTANLYPYAVREVVDGEDAIAVHTNGNPKDNGGVADIWYTATDLDEEGCYSFSFKVKPDNGSNIQVGGRPSNYLTPEYANFEGGFVQLNTSGLYAHNGTEMKQKGDFLEEKWYDVEVVVDYKNMKQSVWVNGEFYADGTDLKFSDGKYNKKMLSMYIKILATSDGKYDVNYIKDIKFNRVWDVKSRATANSDSVGMKLYSGDSVVNKLEPGTYSAKSYGDLICDKFYVAVYKVEYSDSSKSVQTACYPVKVYGTTGSVNDNAVIDGIEVPGDLYSETSDARIMIFCWNNDADPACDFVQID